MALMVKNLPASAGEKEVWFNPWVGKIPWRRKWQPTPIFLPGECPGQRSLVGCSPWGCQELDTTEGTWRACTHTHTHTHTWFPSSVGGKLSAHTHTHTHTISFQCWGELSAHTHTRFPSSVGGKLSSQGTERRAHALPGLCCLAGAFRDPNMLPPHTALNSGNLSMGQGIQTLVLKKFGPQQHQYHLATW